MGWHVTLRTGKFPARILLMRSVKLWDPTSISNFNPRNFNTTTNLQSRLPSGRTWNNVVINIGWFRLPLCQWPKVGLRAAKWLIKKSLNKFFVISRPIYLRDHNATDQAIVPADTGRKLNLHKTFRRRPERLLNVLCTFNLRLVSTGRNGKISKLLQKTWSFLLWKTTRCSKEWPKNLFSSCLWVLHGGKDFQSSYITFNIFSNSALFCTTGKKFLFYKFS